MLFPAGQRPWENFCNRSYWHRLRGVVILQKLAGNTGSFSQQVHWFMSNFEQEDEFSTYGNSRPKKKSKSGCWIWALVITIIVMVLGGIGCCGGLFYFGLNVFNEEVKAQVVDNPVLKEQLGDLETMTVNFIKTGEANNEDVIVYDVKGSKATGTLSVEHTSNDAGDIVVVSATLTLSNGQTFELFPDEVEENSSPDVKAMPIEPDPAVEKLPSDTEAANAENPAPAEA